MSLPAAPGLDVPMELRLRLADLYSEYTDTLDDKDFERWPDLFTENAVYKITPRENYERNLPIALLSCEGRLGLKDRVKALKETTLFLPRVMRHLVSNLRIRSMGPEGVRLTAAFLLVESLLDDPSKVFMCGTYHDRVVEEGGTLRFVERLCVYDSTIVPTSLVFPV